MVDVAATNSEKAIAELLKARTEFARETIQQGVTVVAGPYTLDATHNGIRLAEDFSLQLIVPDDYPARLPKVKEISGAIDSEYEHLYCDETFCLGVCGELFLTQLENPSLVALLDGPVRSYLHSYLFQKRYGYYPFGDRAHGASGVLQYYGELFEETDIFTTIKLLKAVCLDEYRGHLPCPCGSGLITRKCHGETILKLKKSGAMAAFSSDFMVIVNELEDWRGAADNRNRTFRQVLNGISEKYSTSSNAKNGRTPIAFPCMDQ